MIRYFGERKKIFNIHFRNIRGRRDDFQETFPDEGDMDMVAVMRTLKQVGYQHMVMPDHLPRHDDDPRRGSGVRVRVRVHQGVAAVGLSGQQGPGVTRRLERPIRPRSSSCTVGGASLSSRS